MIRRIQIFVLIYFVIATMVPSDSAAAPKKANRIGVLPDFVTPDDIVSPRGELVHFDFRTREETRLPAGEFPDLPRSGFTTEPIKALYGDPGTDTAGDKNFGGWYQIGDPTLGTNPRHVKLEMFSVNALGDTTGGACSGTLISPIHVLTAGHCVYFHIQDGVPFFEYADQVTVTPGYENGSGPWATANAATITSWSGWVDNEDRDHDMALITLDRPLGAFTGWRNYGYNANASFWYDPLWTIKGYPAEGPFDGETQWATQGEFDFYYGNQIKFDNPSWGGSSGSGSVKDDVAYGVLVASDRETNTLITRLTAGKFGDIRNQIAADQPNSPDLWPLQVITSASNDTIDAGATLGSFFFRIHNFSAAAWSGPIPYQIMLSTNQNIAGTDIEIHSGTLNLTIPANGTAGVNVPAVQINPDVPEDNYFVGVRLNVNDANPINDDSRMPDLDLLTVNCPSVTPPWMGLPADNATCVPTTGTQLAWGNVPEAVIYRVTWGIIGTTLTTVDVPGTNYTLPELQPGKEYVWTARAGNACGHFDIGGQSFTFTTMDEPDIPNVVFPVDGDRCQPAYQVVVDWDDVPDATGYQIRVMSSCGFPVTPINTTLSAYPILGLNDDQTYYYQVRTKGQCGNYGEWSECRSFTTRPSVLGVPQQFSPSEGYGCVGSPAAISWETISGADDYEVAFGQSCAGTDTVTVATNQAQLPVTGPGTWYWKVRALRCDDRGDWSACHSFVVDTTAPDTVRNYASISHSPSTWSSEASVTVKWDEVADPGGCGIVFYDLEWNGGDIPPALPWIASATTHPYTTPPLADGTENYVHLWARDAAGNYAATSQSIGPFFIDTTGPDVPQVTTTPPAAGYTNTGTIAASWTVPADRGVGVAGYRAGLVPDAFTDLPAMPLNPDPGVGFVDQPEGIYYLKLAAFDSLGNSSDTLRVGPFTVDRTPPVGAIDQPAEGEVLTHMQMVFVLYTATDNLSGIEWVEFSYTEDDENWIFIADGTPLQIPSGFGWRVPYSTSGTIRMRLRILDRAGNESIFEQAREMTVINTVSVGEDGLPKRTAIAGVGPNPFNPRTTIRYGLPRSGQVHLTVHDATGRLVRTIVSGRQQAGWHERKWNGMTDSGRTVASGVYFARLTSAGETDVQRMTLLK